MIQMRTEELSVKAVSRTMEKEQDRERRRMRDRERRQSMSQEQRQQHLARRHRSYQLRRLKLGKTQLNSQHEQQSIATRDELINTCNWNQALVVVVPDHSIQYDSLGNVDITEGPGKSNPSAMKCNIEPRAHRSSMLLRSLRLNQIRHLARLLNTPSGTKEIGADLSGKQIITGDCILRKNLRLVHVKRLARALNTATVKRNASRTQYGLRGDPSSW